jgi:hypothetical protein
LWADQIHSQAKRNLSLQGAGTFEIKSDNGEIKRVALDELAN